MWESASAKGKARLTEHCSLFPISNLGLLEAGCLTMGPEKVETIPCEKTGVVGEQKTLAVGSSKYVLCCSFSR